MKKFAVIKRLSGGPVCHATSGRQSAPERDIIMSRHRSLVLAEKAKRKAIFQYSLLPPDRFRIESI